MTCFRVSYIYIAQATAVAYTMIVATEVGQAVIPGIILVHAHCERLCDEQGIVTLVRHKGTHNVQCCSSDMFQVMWKSELMVHGMNYKRLRQTRQLFFFFFL